MVCEYVAALDTDRHSFIFRYMSKYKTLPLATPDLDRTAAMFKALANPTRLRIFLNLAACCSSDGSERCVSSEEIGATVGELGDQVDVKLPTVSHHLKELQTAGLITCTRRGQSVICCVNDRAVDVLREFFAELGSCMPD